MAIQSYTELKLRLVELISFFYDNYKEQPLDWFEDVFKEFEKLRKRMGK